MLNYIKKYKELIKENEELKARNEQLERDKTDPVALVNHIVSNGIEWFDYKSLNKEQLLNYYTEAQHILRTQVFQNEISRLTSEWANWCLRHSPDHQATRDMRMQTSALDLLKERFKGVPNPQDDYKPTQEKLNNVI